MEQVSRWQQESIEDRLPGMSDLPTHLSVALQVNAPEIWHLDGVPWHEAPTPSRLHRCAAQTRGYPQTFTYVERCACGGIRMKKNRYDSFRWIEKNQTHGPLLSRLQLRLLAALPIVLALVLGGVLPRLLGSSPSLALLLGLMLGVASGLVSIAIWRTAGDR